VASRVIWVGPRGWSGGPAQAGSLPACVGPGGAGTSARPESGGGSARGRVKGCCRGWEEVGTGTRSGG
jgi:hypothetical protein